MHVDRLLEGSMGFRLMQYRVLLCHTNVQYAPVTDALAMALSTSQTSPTTSANSGFDITCDHSHLNKKRAGLLHYDSICHVQCGSDRQILHHAWTMLLCRVLTRIDSHFLYCEWLCLSLDSLGRWMYMFLRDCA